VSSDNFVVVDTTRDERVIGETDFTSGPSTLHEKAIYMVEGALYQVERFDFDGRKAYVRSVDCDYYTTAISYSKVTILETFETGVGMSSGSGIGDPWSERPESSGKDLDGFSDLGSRTPDPDSEAAVSSRRSHGEVHVVSRVVGFKKIKFYTNENVGSGDLDLPEQQMHTSSYWLTVPAAIMSALPYSIADRRDGIIGLAFAMKNIAQLLLMCDGHDIGLSVDGGALDRPIRTAGIPGVPDALAAEPDIFIYDNYPGGIGFSRPLFEMHDQLLARTRDLIMGCPCDSGCPSCVGPEGNTGPRAKRVALHVLSKLVAREAV
jgi:DEAD/DEAH box helicase domain-containing protein